MIKKRKRITLTQTQKDFIDQNWQRLSLEEMASRLEFASNSRVCRYLKKMGYNKKQKTQLDEYQKQFVRDNYLKMKEQDIASVIGVTKFHIQEFKRSEGLAKNIWNRKEKEKEEVSEMYFNVDARESWVA